MLFPQRIPSVEVAMYDKLEEEAFDKLFAAAKPCCPAACTELLKPHKNLVIAARYTARSPLAVTDFIIILVTYFTLRTQFN